MTLMVHNDFVRLMLYIIQTKELQDFKKSNQLIYNAEEKSKFKNEKNSDQFLMFFIGQFLDYISFI